jgi:CubicO group peptidase (beta-lactamase class C family)
MILSESVIAAPVPQNQPDSGGLANQVAESLAIWLPQNLQERGVPGAAAAVVDKHGIIWLETWGTTRGKTSPSITRDTVFCIRSVSKSVTALAVLVAVQEGLVDLDTPISEYLPGFKINSRFDQNPENLITLRHMLAHWAGFTHDPPVGINLKQPGYFHAYIERISATWLRFPVGYRYQYANYGFDLAGYILELQSGTTFSNYVQEKVLAPIGMVNSTFDQEFVARMDDRAGGHRNEETVSIPFPEIPSGGLYSSIGDMAKLAMFHINDGMADGRRILRRDLMEQYHAIQFAREDQETGYTLGLIREPVGSTYSLYHEGGGRGFGSHLMIYPEIGVAAILLTNREYHGLTGQSGRIVMNTPVLDKYGPRKAADSRSGEMEKLDSTDPRVKQILGRYGDSPGIVVEVVDDQPVLRTGRDQVKPLELYSDDGELVGMYDARMEARFLPPYGNHRGSMMVVSRMVGNSNNHYHDFNDSPGDPAGPDKHAWRKFTGLYEVFWEDEPVSTAVVEIRNGYLYFRDGKCEEFEPGLFFLYDGEALDFRNDPPTFATQEIRRTSEAPAPDPFLLP